MEVAAEGCRACELYEDATQVVFGSGRSNARLMLVGEQPGHYEDLAGEPFVGQAGAVLAAALKEAGISEDEVYVTNVVKHFHFKAGEGKKRLHQTPKTRHIKACLPWFEAEVERVRPAIIVCLGATAAQSLLGRDFRVTRDRGLILEWNEHAVIATMHPAAVLRARDQESRKRLRSDLVEDLKTARRYAKD
jgi:uracil-DNA glycosylase